jgi:hypothetical protein
MSDTGLANPWLNMIAGTAFSAPAGSYVQLHTGDPGANGTANAVAIARFQLTWALASGGIKAITATLPSWANWAAGTQVITHLSFWDAASNGTFRYSCQLTVAKTVNNTDTLNITAHQFQLGPIAA